MGAQDRFLRVSIASLAIFLLFIAASEAYTNVQIFGPRCLEKGRFSFTLINRNSDPLLLKDTEIIMSHPKLGTFPAHGTWNKESIAPGTTSSEIAVFTSGTGNLNLSGGYDGVMLFDGCRTPPCREVFRVDHCADFRYSCDITQFAINQCFLRGNMLWLRLSGLNAGQNEHLDPNRGLAISIESNARTIRKATHIANMTLTQDGADAYTLKIPAEPGERFFEVDVQPWHCKDNVVTDAFRCVLNPKPLVDRKLNASIENRNGSSSPSTRLNPVVAPPQPRQTSGTNRSASIPSTPLPAQQGQTREEETTRTAPARIAPAVPLENQASKTKMPLAQRSGTRSAPQEKVSKEMIAFMTALGIVWLAAIIIIVILLVQRRS